MIGFNSNFHKNNIKAYGTANNLPQQSYCYSGKSAIGKDSVELSTKRDKKESFISRIFGTGKNIRPKESNIILNYNINPDFGKVQKLKAEEIGESQAKLAIKKAFESGIDNLNYMLLAEDEYDRIRESGKYKVDYGSLGISSNEEYLLTSIAGFDPGDDFYNLKTYNIDGKDIAQVKVFPLKHWVWRNGSGGDISSRVSLNVKPEGDFINELDIFMKTGMYTDSNGKPAKVENVTNFFYKTPLNQKSWNERQDPVTVYFRSDVNDETYKAIADISSRYARGYVNNGNGNAPWISNIEKDINEEMVNSLIKELETYSKRAASTLKSTYASQSKALSSGQYQAYINILSYMK